MDAVPDGFALLSVPTSQDNNFENNPDVRLDFIEAALPFHLFSVRLTNCLRGAGIETIGHMLAALFDKREFKQMGSRTRNELDGFLHGAARRAGTTPFWEEDSVACENYFPSDEEIRTTENRVCLPAALESIAVFLFNGADGESLRYGILARRACLNGHRLYTLEELALLYGKSRERIRQIERDVAGCFATFLEKGSLKKVDKTLHTGVREEMQALVGLLTRKGLLIRPDEMQSTIEARYGRLTTNQRNVLFYCLELFGIVPMKMLSNAPDRQTVWLTNEPQKEQVLNIENLIAQQFKLQILPVPLDDIIIHANKNLRLQNQKVPPTLRVLIEETLSLCDFVEPCPLSGGNNGSAAFHTAFVRLPNNAHRVHRVLYEKGEPMRTHELVKEVNHRIVSSYPSASGRYSLVTETTVVNPLAAYEAVVSEGRSRWKLKEWGGETRTILQIMKEFFHHHNRPATPDAVFAYVQARRHVKRNSVTIYLSMNKMFRRVSPHEYALASWRQAEYPSLCRRRVSQARFDAVIQAVFATEQKAFLTIPFLAEEFRKVLHCSEMSTRIHLKASSRVRLVRNANEARYRVYLNDTKGPFIPEARKSKTKTQRVQVQEEIVRLLGATAEQGMKSAVLVKKVMQATLLPRTPVYIALGKMKPNVERFVDVEGIRYRLRKEPVSNDDQ